MRKLKSLVLLHVEKLVLAISALGFLWHLFSLATASDMGVDLGKVSTLVQQIEAKKKESKPPRLEELPGASYHDRKKGAFAKMQAVLKRIPSIRFEKAWRFYPFPRLERTWRCVEDSRREFPIGLTDVKGHKVLDGEKLIEKLAVVKDEEKGGMKLEVRIKKLKEGQKEARILLELFGVNRELKESVTINVYAKTTAAAAKVVQFKAGKPRDLKVRAERGGVEISFKGTKTIGDHLGFHVYRKLLTEKEFHKIHTIRWTQKYKKPEPSKLGKNTEPEELTAEKREENVWDTVHSYRDSDIKPDTYYVYAVDAYGENPETGEDLVSDKLVSDEVLTKADTDIYFNGYYPSSGYNVAILVLVKWLTEEKNVRHKVQIPIGERIAGKKKKTRPKEKKGKREDEAEAEKKKEPEFEYFDTGATLVDVVERARFVKSEEKAITTFVNKGGRLVKETRKVLVHQVLQKPEIVIVDAKGRVRVLPKTKPPEDREKEKEKKKKKKSRIRNKVRGQKEEMPDKYGKASGKRTNSR